MIRTGNYKKLSIPSGTKYGLLTVISEADRVLLPSGQTNRRLLCRCDCGNEKAVRVMHLTRGRIRSCGCLGGEQHGDSGSLLYNVWNTMKFRCASDKHIDHHRYKDRGVTVCKEWYNSFISFKKWALHNGYRHGLQIDRIDNDGNYEPNNCRIVTRIINVNNREVTLMVDYNGQYISLCLLLRSKNLFQNYDAIYSRIKRGWSAQKAIDTPIRKGRYGKRQPCKITCEITEDI